MFHPATRLGEDRIAHPITSAVHFATFYACIADGFEIERELGGF
jgi:hypothetical protein